MCIQIVINTYNRRKLHVNTANPSYCWIIFAKQVPFPIFFPLDRAKRNKMALKDNWCTVLFLLDISLVEISFSFMPNIPRWDDWTLLIKKNPSRMIFLLFFLVELCRIIVVVLIVIDFYLFLATAHCCILNHL